MNKTTKLFFAMLLTFTASQSCKYSKSTTTNQKVETLLSQMTLDEKIGQLNQYTSKWEMTGPAPDGKDEQEQMQMIKNGLVGSMLNVTGVEATRKTQKIAVENSRLGIPMIFGYDVIHGYKTMLPIPLAAAASWDPEVEETSCRIAASEAAASGIHWTFAPMVDISRDARWGRVMEGAGEDPYLGSIMAAAQVRGFQGKALNAPNTIASCAKHFAAYGFVGAGLDYSSVEITENTLRNIVLPPFKACSDAGVSSFMNAFNDIGGTPATANTHLLRDILKGEWQYKGFVVSDWNSIGEIKNHGVAPNKKEATYLAMKAGSDMDMEGDCYIKYLKELVEEGRIDVTTIDDAVRRILTIKYELGLFDDPYCYCNTEKEKIVLSKEHLTTARNLAKKSIVLLKNDRHLLPLKKEGQKIGIIGTLANDKDSPLGSWRAQAITNSAVSIVEGMNNAITNKELLHFEKGPDFITNKPEFTQELTFNNTDLTGIKKAVKLAMEMDVVVLALGENCFQTGEGRGQTDIKLKGVQQQLLEAVYAVNKNVVVVLMNGRPLAIEWMANHVPAIVESWYLGSESGNAIADVLFGDYNPSGKLPMSFPRSVGQCPIYYNHNSTGRPTNKEDNVFWSHYTDQPKTPLFPFGYGLSYTTFEYSNLKFNTSELKSGKTLDITFTLKNTGKVKGEEVTQLYIQDLFGSTIRPVKELKRFKKIELEANESVEVKFQLTAKDLAFYNAEGLWKAEPGDFKLWVGTNSQQGLEEQFTLIE